MKRKSDSSDDQIFDQEEKSSEPQEKQAVPNTWLTANKEEVPAVAVKRKKFGQGEHHVSIQQKLTFTFVSSG
jgi:hypothetical protein